MANGKHRQGSTRPYDCARLEELALNYVARYATSRAKLRTYLSRKIREKGWSGESEPPIDAIIERMVALRFVDDQGFARMKSESLTRRGYGPGRVHLALRAAGISEEDSAEARSASDAHAEQAALAFAKRKRIGPYFNNLIDDRARNKALAAMCRAGHSFELSRAIIFDPARFSEDEANIEKESTDEM